MERPQQEDLQRLKGVPQECAGRRHDHVRLQAHQPVRGTTERGAKTKTNVNR